MRETLTSLKNTTFDYISHNTGNVQQSSLSAFVIKELNKGKRTVQMELRNYQTQELPKTASTVADQQFYHYPPGVVNIEAVTVTVSSVKYPLRTVHSLQEWDRLNEKDFSGTTIPQFIFPRRDDFGIYPTPAAVYTITFVQNAVDKDMANEDYTDGTVAVTENSATVTGTSTTWTTAMQGRWFRSDDDGYWYRVSTVSSTTSLTLESVFEGTTDTSSTYIIGESPEIPMETHILLPYYAAGQYFMGPRKDFEAGQRYMNYFYYGTFNPTALDLKYPKQGLYGVKARYSSRDNSAIGYRQFSPVNRFDERWGTTLS